MMTNAQLTDRETQVLYRLAGGTTPHAIATELGVNEARVYAIGRQLKKKLGLPATAPLSQILSAAYDQGLFD